MKETDHTPAEHLVRMRIERFGLGYILFPADLVDKLRDPSHHVFSYKIGVQSLELRRRPFL